MHFRWVLKKKAQLSAGSNNKCVYQCPSVYAYTESVVAFHFQPALIKATLDWLNILEL